MKIYDQKILEVSIYGTIMMVSVNELFQLLADGFRPTLTEEATDELKRLMWLTTQIFVQGNWFLGSKQEVVSAEVVKNKKKTPKR